MNALPLALSGAVWPFFDSGCERGTVLALDWRWTGLDWTSMQEQQRRFGSDLPDPPTQRYGYSK
jgi:hypothetical protein